MKRKLLFIFLLVCATGYSFAQDYKHLKKDVKSGDKLKIEMAPGGGWVAKISLK